MSVAEIKAELPHLSAAERKEIALALLALNEAREETPRVAEDFAQAKGYVFDNYGDLLRRLAQ